jgi:hypothetical protein
MKNVRMTVVFLSVVLITACLVVLPVAAVDPVTAIPDSLDLTVCYPDGGAGQQIMLKNDNDISLHYQAFAQNIPSYSINPYDATVGAKSLLPVDIQISALPDSGGPGLPVGEYYGTVFFDFGPPGSAIGVPVHYSVVNCNPSPEFPVASGMSVPFVSAGLIGALICLILLIKKQ